MFPYTSKQLRKMQKKAFQELLDEAGGATHLAKMLGVNPSMVKNWVTVNRISRHGVKLVQEHDHLGKLFPVKRLRPELEGVESSEH